MTDREFNALRKRIRKIADRWHAELGLRWWKVVMLWERSAPDGETLAEVNYSWQYQRAEITFYMPNLLGASDDDIEGTVVHEFCHILVAELQQHRGKEHVEHTVCSLTNAFRWVRDAAIGGKLPRPAKG